MPLKIAQPTLTIMKLDFTAIAWYRRLWAVIKLPYDMVRFIVQGEAHFGYFRNEDND